MTLVGERVALEGGQFGITVTVTKTLAPTLSPTLASTLALCGHHFFTNRMAADVFSAFNVGLEAGCGG